MLATSKILVNQWRNEPSSRYLLGHHLAFTKTGQEPEHEHFLLSKGRQGEGCMAALVQVARIGEVPSGKLLTVNLHGQPVLLANVDGTIYALSGMCGHADGPLDRGKLRDGLVECPFHGGRFEVRSGKTVMLPATDGIATFAVRIEGDAIQVALP
jgi:3-phenylpropionate/trans-cinnamate dioxygenase ferredoxin component